METVFVIAVIIVLIIYLIAQDSKKETARERYGEAVGTLAYATADSISGFAHSLTEPANKKQIRLAKEALASRHGSLYRLQYYNDKDYIDKLFFVDESFKQALDILGLSEERWRKIALHIYYIGAIKVMSRENSDYSKKNSEYIRRSIIDDWSKPDSGLKDHADTLKKGLNYFNISVEEWIKYGDTVIEMHNLNDKKDVEEFGYIVQIMPMKNNMHLL